MIRLDFEGQTVETATVGFVRHLDLRDIQSMKLCTIFSLYGLYRPEPFADKAAYTPTQDRVLDSTSEGNWGCLRAAPGRPFYSRHLYRM